MKEHIMTLGSKFRRNWKHYVGQSLFATMIFAAILIALNVQMRPIITASVGATAFIVFALPSDVTADPRNILGGHSIGVLCGAISATIMVPSYEIAFYSLAVGLSIFFMVITDLEHPPASGTALGITVSGLSFNVVATLLCCVAALAAVRHVFRGHLRDLR